MKRIFSILLATVMLVGVVSSACFSSTVFAASGKKGAAAYVSESEIIDVVGMLEIMVGDQYGNLNLDGSVTRAQFVKMMVNASAYKSEVKTGTSYSPYPDVRNTHWASPFIQVAATQGLVKGYLDGTFRPDNYVKLEEAVTVALRLLGYGASDLQGVYPAPQMAMYNELLLKVGVKAVQGENLSRRDCMYLIYNMLCSEKKDGSVYCQSLGYAVTAEGIIDYVSLIDSETDGEFVFTDSLSDTRMSFDPVSASNVRIFRDNVTAFADEICEYDYICFNNATRTVRAYSDKAFGVIDKIVTSGANPSAVVVGGASYNVTGTNAAFKLSDFGEFDVDDLVMLVFDRKGDVFDVFSADEAMIERFADKDTKLSDIVDSSLDGGKRITDLGSFESMIPFDTAEAKFYLDEKTASPEDMRVNDIVYWSEPFKRVYLYRQTDTGILSSITPEASPTTLAVNGTVYSIANNDVSYKVSSLGRVFAKDDFVTIFLGKGNAVEDIIPGDISFIDDTDDDTDIIGIIEATIEGTIIADKDGEWKKELPIDIQEATFVSGGSTEDRISKADDVKEGDILYWSEPFNTVYVYRDTVTGVIKSIVYNSGMPSSVVMGQTTYNLGSNSVKISFYNNLFRKDDFVTLSLGRKGEIVAAKQANAADFSNYSTDSATYAEVLNSTISDPVLVLDATNSWQSELPFDVHSQEVSVYCENKEIDPDEVEAYSVVYYSAPLKTVLVFEDKITGTFEACSPSRISPTSATIAGVSYSLETSDVVLAFSNIGSFKYGDIVTIVPGISGGIAAVFDGNETSSESYGVITDVSERQYTRSNGTTYTADTVTVVLTSGKTVTYEHNDNGFDNGDFVKVTVKNGTAAITKTTSKAKTADVTAVNKLIASSAFSQGAVIYDVYCSSVMRIYPSRLEGVKLVSKDILYCELDSSGDIDTLILNDFTGDMHKYMYLESRTSRSSSTSSATYYGYMDGILTSVSGGNFVNIKDECGIVVKYENNAIKRIESINATSVSVKNLTEDFCVINDEIYEIWDKAQAYAVPDISGDYEQTTVEDILAGNYSTIRVFYDKTPERGGKIRFIMAR